MSEELGPIIDPICLGRNDATPAPPRGPHTEVIKSFLQNVDEEPTPDANGRDMPGEPASVSERSRESVAPNRETVVTAGDTGGTEHVISRRAFLGLPEDSTDERIIKAESKSWGGKGRAMLGMGALLVGGLLAGLTRGAESEAEGTIQSTSTQMIGSAPSYEQINLSGGLAPLAENEYIAPSSVVASTTTTPSTTSAKELIITTAIPESATTVEFVAEVVAKEQAVVTSTSEVPYDPYEHGFNCDTDFEVKKDMNASEIAARCEGRNVWLGFELIVGDVISVADMTPPSTPTTGSPERNVSTGGGDCAGLTTKQVTIGEGNFFYDYFMGKGNSSISLTQAQTERLLWGTNFAQRCGINLNNVVAGRTVKLPTDEAELLRVYKSVAAIQD